ncbi:MAG: NAD-dependent succinate-semialdehyde dehydrogenase [Puia sp.]|nr:NAD-dependent succinate-semialdehyde dehydrogenase [Puia sp.]
MYKQYIDGAWAEAIGKQVIELVNPATEEAIAALSYAGAADCHLAIGAAQTAFKSWRKTTPYIRAAILKKAALLIRERVELLARDMVLESGKPLAEARGEWNVAANLFEWYAEEAKRAYGRVIPANRADKRSTVIWQPLGVVGVITAWNFPAYNPARAWAAALAAGCTVVAKPAETTPLSAVRMTEALIDAGLPKGVLNLLIGDPEAIGDAMLDNPALRKISFTGSTRVGKLLMDGASRTHTRLSLELGGNAPVLIFEDVDVDAIAKAASIARFRNNGQVCIAPQRFYVHKKIYTEFARLVTGYVAGLKTGIGFDESVQVGPLITRKQRDSVLALLEKARAEDAQVLTGGHPPAGEGRGYFIEPAVVACTGQSSVLARQEIFGPILPLFSFEDMEDAIAKANDTEYGLAAYLFTNNLQTAIQAAERLEFGIVGINEWAPHGTEAPFGGWKYSGQGHESGSEGLYEYLEKKLISIGGLNF